MCGGKGTRLDAAAEKPLFEIAGTPMVDRVLDALAASRVESVRAAVSPHAPETREHLRERPCDVIETPGEGYVSDLGAALSDDRVGRPALTCVADLPLLAADPVDDALATHEARDAASLTVAVPAALKRLLGTSVDTTMTHEAREVTPTGLNVVGADDGDAIALSYDARLAINVNRATDATVAERLTG
jgi:adenosylcobinamide-phosphate guanylyltransferase